MPVDGRAFEEVLSLHLGGYRGGISPLIRRDMEGGQTGRADY
jgi:hypothetical protein